MSTSCRDTYFGQTESSDCLTCDVCRAKGPEKLTREVLLRFASEHPGATLRDLKQFCDNPRNGLPQNALELWRSMMDEGVVPALRPE